MKSTFCEKVEKKCKVKQVSEEVGKNEKRLINFLERNRRYLAVGVKTYPSVVKRGETRYNINFDTHSWTNERIVLKCDIQNTTVMNGIVRLRKLYLYKTVEISTLNITDAKA